MNRLILIGNGFDLAHGMKTSYRDFIIDYFKKCHIEALEKLNYTHLKDVLTKVYEDDLIEIKAGKTDRSLRTESILGKIKEQIYTTDSIEKIKGLTEQIDLNVFPKGDGFARSLFNELINNNWVDIESLYYTELKKLIPKIKSHKGGIVDDPLVNNKATYLNKQLDFVKKKLKDYLLEIIIEENKPIEDYHTLFRSNQINLGYKLPPKRSLILNFNYTNTPNRYSMSETFETINIHGELKSETNTIIFGYGDEIDQDYREIEALNENELLKHIKSFDYFKTGNYNKLLKFISEDKFEIFIMGHSCGVSDRTLLSSIFCHENCKSIRIFYHTEEDYRNKTYEISRHFNNKDLMRRRIVNKEISTAMPQLK